MTIPKILHQIWIGKNPIEDKCLKASEITKNNNPDYEYYFWTDANVYDFIRINYNELYENFCALPRFIMKVDVLRFILLYHFGGFVIDMDYIVVKHLDEELLKNNVIIPKNRDDGFSLGNCILGSKPKKEIWKKYFEICLNKEYYLKFNSNNDMYLFAGPDFLKNYKFDDQDIYYPERIYFHPDTNKYIQSKKLDDKSYGVHLCSGLWII